MNRPRAHRVLATASLVLIACAGNDASFAGPKGRDTFARYVAIGTGISMGVRSAGVVYESQLQSWPALLAAQAGAAFDAPLLRTPGCSPPLIAPLNAERYLSGASSTARDSSCAGALGTYTLPRGNVAIPGSTWYTALHLTPKVAAASLQPIDVVDRAIYPLVLGLTQSQVTATIVSLPTLISLELGFGEIVTAATTGQLVAATAYKQLTPFTYVPAVLADTQIAAIADSLKRTGARVLVATVPRVSTIAALRAGDELWQERVVLATFGVAVNANCNGSTNRVVTTIVPTLVALARSSGSAQSLSCADVPGAADRVLTAADVTTLNAIVDAMNVRLAALAGTNGWALMDLNAVMQLFVSGRPAYKASVQLSCNYPYGQFVSLDGVYPTVAGQQQIANAAASALNAKFGFALPTTNVEERALAQLCP